MVAKGIPPNGGIPGIPKGGMPKGGIPGKLGMPGNPPGGAMKGGKPGGGPFTPAGGTRPGGAPMKGGGPLVKGLNGGTATAGVAAGGFFASKIGSAEVGEDAGLSWSGLPLVSYHYCF